MASTKISALTALTAPALNDVLPIVDVSVTTTKKIVVSELRGSYCLVAAAASSSPADATTYYYGSLYALAITATAGACRVYIPRAGTITSIAQFIRCTGVSGTSETSTIALLLNGSSATTISSAVTVATGAQFTATATVSITVAAGDYFEIRWVTPTWVTNPTALYFQTNVYIT